MLSLSPARPAKCPGLARSVPYARYPHELHGYIYTMIFALRGATRHWWYILMQSYLQHQDIDGHLLRLYIYIFMRGYLHHGRDGTAIFGGASVARTLKFCFLSIFVLLLFRGRFEQGLNDPNNTSCLTDYTLAPPPCGKPCAITIPLEQNFEYIEWGNIAPPCVHSKSL